MSAQTPIDFFTPQIPKEKWHHNFKNMMKQNQDFVRTQFQKWAEGFKDRDNKIVKEFQESYNSSFWEIYLHALFKELGYCPIYDYPSPDFLIEFEGHKIAIEASIASNPQGGRAEHEVNFPNDYKISNNDFNRRAIIRYANTITEKYKKYKNSYEKLDHVKGIPYVIALGAFDQPASFLEYDRAMLPTLYGLLVDEYGDYSGEIAYQLGTSPVKIMTSIPKSETADIPLGFFRNPCMCEVSAVLYNCVATYSKLIALAPYQENKINLFLGTKVNEAEQIRNFKNKKPYYKETIQDGLCIFHNPWANNPLPENMFKQRGITNYYYDITNDFFYRKRDGDFLVMRNHQGFNLIDKENEDSYSFKKKMKTRAKNKKCRKAKQKNRRK